MLTMCHTLIYSMPSRQQLRVNYVPASHCADKRISRLRQAKVFGRSYFYNCVSLCKILYEYKEVPGLLLIEERGLSVYTVMVEVCWTLGCVCANNKQPVRKAKHMPGVHKENIVEHQWVECLLFLEGLYFKVEVAGMFMDSPGLHKRYSYSKEMIFTQNA